MSSEAASSSIVRLAVAVAVAAGAAVAMPLAAGAQGGAFFDRDAAETVDEEPRNRFGVEAKVHYRDSDPLLFPVNFPFSPDQLPPGAQRGTLETVEAGDHTEVSVVSLWWRGRYGAERGLGAVSTKIKLDVIDRYDRNPTSTDNEWDLDEAWVRFGREVEPGDGLFGRPACGAGYVKLGKFPKFERQNDRHLESYGLVGTAFNRAEDIGLETGADIFGPLYFVASLTAGNPVFMRDPNALAGDHGISDFDGSVLNPDPELKSGFPILYDADAELDDLDLTSPESGLGLGLRFGDRERWSLDVLASYYARELEDTAELEGTFYGGDLDLLLGPLNAFPYPVTSDTKEELGLTLWLYAGGLSVFGQYIDQDLAGLGRDGLELEVAYRFELPYFGAIFGRQALSFIAPAVRYSELNNDFGPPPITPAPNLAWDWEKLDLGVRAGLIDGLLDLTLEYADNEFIRAGRAESADELLATFRLQWDREF